MSLQSDTKKIQSIVGVTADGIWGKNTASAVLNRLNSIETPEPPVILPAGFDARVMNICNQVINCFETGSKNGNYSDVTVYKDGGNGSYHQITYGRSGITQDHNLDKLLQHYFELCKERDKNVQYVLKANYPTKNKRDLHKNAEFKAALKAAGKTPEMIESQDTIVYDRYMAPALEFCKVNGLVLPLSLLVVFDSYIHSGQIRKDIRNTFSATTPSKGGDEKKWTEAYVEARRKWLSGELPFFRSNSLLKKTVYRTKCFKSIIGKNDWNLTSQINANGIIV